MVLFHLLSTAFCDILFICCMFSGGRELQVLCVFRPIHLLAAVDTCLGERQAEKKMK